MVEASPSFMNARILHSRCSFILKDYYNCVS